MDTEAAFQDDTQLQQVHTLGSVRLRHKDTREVILIPTPSDDPNDPLNWSKKRRYFIAIITCAAILVAQTLAAGPSVAIIDMTIDLLGAPPGTPGFPDAISKIAYVFTVIALMQGVSNFFYMPLIIKYGRRVVYIGSFALYGVTAIWAGAAQTFPSLLAARVVMGFACGSAECLAPLTITDIFFLHERGLVMACYSTALSSGIALGVIISGLITINNSWRAIFYVGAAFIWALVLAVFFTMPETAYNRVHVAPETQPSHAPVTETATGEKSMAHVETTQIAPRKKTYKENLSLRHGPLTQESLLKIFWRPIPLVLLPPVLYASLVLSVSIGVFVAISSNFAAAFGTLYLFQPWQVGLCYISALIGSLIGIAGGGWLLDVSADYLTKRNDGIREPEMRLPSIMLSTILTPVSLILYGCGIANGLHWMVPTLGLGILSFCITQSSTVVIVYTVDAYRPIAGEVIVAQLAFKACFGFLVSFYTNPWIEQSGYQNAFGAMAGMCAGVYLFWIPLYFYGRRIRHASMDWSFMRSIDWKMDREVGE